MKFNKTFIIGLIIMLLAISAGGVAAQDTTPDEGPPGRSGRFDGSLLERLGEARQNRDRVVTDIIETAFDLIQEEIGLDRDALQDQTGEGSTLAEIITANGGDVENIISDILATITEQVNTAVSEEKLTQDRADQLLGNLEDRINSFLDRELPLRPDRDRVVIDMLQTAFGLIQEETGLDRAALAELAEPGDTVAEIITANGGDVENTINGIMTTITEQVNAAVAEEKLSQERADQLLGNLEDRISDFMDREFPLRDGSPAARDRSLELNDITSTLTGATGLTRQEILSNLRDGKSLAEMLTANGIDVDTFITETANDLLEKRNAQVETPQLDDETFLERVTERLTQLLNRKRDSQI